MGFVPGSAPGTPGNFLGIQPSSGSGGGSDAIFDLPPDSGGLISNLIVNRTIYYEPLEAGYQYPGIGGHLWGKVLIPPTTSGNTLVIVQMRYSFVSWPIINGIVPGFQLHGDYPNPGYFFTFDNTPENGAVGDHQSAIFYVTDIAAGISEIQYGSYPGVPLLDLGYVPTLTIVYELVPCTVVGLNATVTDASSDPPRFLTGPPLVIPAVSGPDANGFYISTMTHIDRNDAGYAEVIGNFSAVSSPWEIDYQQTIVDRIAGVVAIIPVGSGAQQATFTWDGSTQHPFYMGSSISLQMPAGEETPPAVDDVNQFLPNVWIVS